MKFWYAFLVILFLYMVSFFVTMGVGNKRVLMPAFDSNARACGLHEETKDYPYIYFAVS